MYEWFKILDTTRLTGKTAVEDSNIANWSDLAIRFIVDVKIEPDIIVGVDCFSLFYELLNAGMTLSTDHPLNVVIGEGWQMTGSPVNGQRELSIGFELIEGRKPAVIKILSNHETMLFIATKICELVASLERLDVRVESYLERFPPEIYFRKHPS